MPSNRLRLFYALWPDEATCSALAQLQLQARGRKTRRQNLHLTLAFLGDQPAAVLPLLQTILRQLPGPAPVLTIDRFGYFAGSRIAWAGMQAVPDELLQLQKTLAQKLEQRGIGFDRRPVFKPHITLARHAEAPAQQILTPFVWQATQVALVQSGAEGDGSLYRVLGSHRLDDPQ
jgi:RNA 2',3'-cyclic 3'-phosphodiesterase